MLVISIIIEFKYYTCYNQKKLYKKALTMEYKLVKQLRDDDKLRLSFLSLSQDIFGLNFEVWYKNGFWTDKYIPYSIIVNDQVVANASVNIMDFVYDNKLKPFIQIGTVMTKPDYRNRGLCKILINEIISDWKDKCKCIYLFANSTVNEFYPKFGFKRLYEYKYSLPVLNIKGDFKKLNTLSLTDVNIIKSCYKLSNPYSQFKFINNFGLLMFYCQAYFKDCVYYSNKNNAICIAEISNDTIICHDIFGNPKCSLKTFLSELSSGKANKAVLGFTPFETSGCTFCKITDNDDALFVLANDYNIFKNEKLMFPTLSHA